MGVEFIVFALRLGTSVALLTHDPDETPARLPETG